MTQTSVWTRVAVILGALSWFACTAEEHRPGSNQPAYAGFSFCYYEEEGAGGERQGWLAVGDVVPQSPAAGAGLLRDDLITHIDRRPVRFVSDEEVRAFFGRYVAGDEIRFTVRRGTEHRDVHLILASPLEWLGVSP